MTPERWKQIEELFHAVIELPADERRQFLDVRKNGDDTLKTEVERLLDQYDEADSFISQPLLDSTRGGVLSSLLDESDEDPLTGKRLGSYRIEREIGRGGMGAVYEALRADGEFHLRVAIKVVKRGVDTDFVLRRFRNERQILAALDHPYITSLIDGGTTDDGRPYFVMDHIDGLPLYRYADKHRLSLSDKLRLFCRICEAVEYAHQKLVIHRDLKPSNILVTADGTPRLLDFGIAKLLDPELAVDTLQPTATALRMMTVDYASPEQVKGEKITYATDVYSLGVILFELLTRHRPYSLQSRAAHEVARAICDVEPELPSRAVMGGASTSVRVNTTATTLSSLENGPGESAQVLSEQLAGNLDNIIMKALRKEPSERYESVAAFRADVERHLSGAEVDVPLYFPRTRSIHQTYAPEGKLLAVLPLSLMSPATAENTDEAYLMIGLADAIITRLTSVRKLTVRPTSSITRYNEHHINPLRAGRELGVDFVLDGRIRRFGERLRISLQLLDVHNGSAIWAGQFDENLTDVLEMEDAISAQVAAALIPQLTGEDRRRLAKRGTNDPRAYEAYLRGRFYWNQFTSQSLPKALEAFESAIEFDPEYAMAHAAIADFYIWGNIYGLIPVPESYRKAEAAVRRALEIDDELGDAYASFGLLILNTFRHRKAEELFRRAIALNANNALAHEWYAALLVTTGRPSAGVAEIELAEELDPLSLRTKTLVVWTNYQAGNFESALSKAEEIIRLDPGYPQGHLQRGYVLCEMNRADEGVASIEHSMELMPGSALSQYHLAFALKAAGRQADASKLFHEMKERATREYIKPMFLGLAAFAAGEMAEAFEYFDIAVDECDPWLTWFATDAKLVGLRHDPRYGELIQRMKLRDAEHGELAPARVTGDPLGGGDGGPQTKIESMPPTGTFRSTFIGRHVIATALAAVVLIALGAFGLYQSRLFRWPDRSGGSTTETAAGKKLVILPFRNATSDPANEYLCDGIAENLIERLASSPTLAVVSHDTALRYKDTNMAPRAIGSSIGADGVLTGSVSQAGGDLVVEVELVRVADGVKLKSFNFREGTDRVALLQNKIVSTISDYLGARSSSVAAAPKTSTESNEAFQLYLKAEFYRQKGTPADTRAAIDLDERAVEADPNYALAYQGLSLAYRSAPAYGWLAPQVAYSKAREAAQKALTLDPSLATPYVSLASIQSTYDWDFAGAEKQYRRAIEIQPNNAEAHYSYGNFLVAMGRVDEALVQYRMAQQADPLSQNIATNVGWALYIAGRYDEAAAQVRGVLDRDPSFARAYLNLGEILQEQGKYDEAIAAIQRAREMSKDPLADMAAGHAYATAGRKAEALKIAQELETRVRSGEISTFLPGVVYAGLNDKDKAFYWLERAYQERSNWLILIKVGRRLKNLHGDPRFDDLMKRVGFTA